MRASQDMAGGPAAGRDRPAGQDFSRGDAFLYSVIILMWGTSWFAIKMQLGVVSPEVSVAYRFALAAILLFVWLAITRKPLRFAGRHHLAFAAMGATMFPTNFALFYHAGFFLVSGLLAVVFSTVPVFNMLNAFIFLRERPSGKVLLASGMGIAGLLTIFAPDILAHGFDHDTATGLVLCVLATYSFSLGNIVSARNQRIGLPVMSGNAYGMAYGAIMLCTYAILSGTAFTFDPSIVYVSSLLWLAIGASVIAFASYLTLLGRVGPSRAGYVTIVFPIVALVLSMQYEAYQFSIWALAGLALVVAGNLMIIRK